MIGGSLVGVIAFLTCLASYLWIDLTTQVLAHGSVMGLHKVLGSCLWSLIVLIQGEGFRSLH